MLHRDDVLPLAQVWVGEDALDGRAERLAYFHANSPQAGELGVWWGVQVHPRRYCLSWNLPKARHDLDAGQVFVGLVCRQPRYGCVQIGVVLTAVVG